jgi:hypothetical protein
MTFGVASSAKDVFHKYRAVAKEAGRCYLLRAEKYLDVSDDY